MDTTLCPAFRCTEGALIIGVNEDQKTNFLPRTITVDDQFASIIFEEPLSAKFRYAGSCRKEHCAYYRRQTCKLIQQELTNRNPPIRVSNLPKCAIRKNCRWYAEKGFYACSICPEIQARYVERQPEKDLTFYYHRLA